MTTVASLRFPQAVVLALVVTALSAPAANAAPETCRGLPVTAVGTPGDTLRGTPGNDVLVTNGAYVTKAGAGNDTICVTAGNASVEVEVDAGPGADTVDTTGTKSFAELVLGSGADTLWGGDSGHKVTTGAADGTDRDTDRVTTGSSFDSVVTGESGQPDADQIDIGADTGNIQVLSQRPTGLLRAAPGADANIQLAPLGPGRWLVDDELDRATRNGVTMATWENLDVTTIRTRPGSHLHYVGTQQRDVVQIFGDGGIDGVDLGDGNDRVEIRSRGAITGTVSGGGRKDDVMVVADEVVADLRGGELSIRSDDAGGRIAGFSNLDIKAASATIHGNRLPNHIWVDACRVSVWGGAGNDQILSSASHALHSPCHEVADEDLDIRLYGGRGDDVLGGQNLPEHLFGGPGTDLARAYGGYDVCRAEEVHGCEA